MSTFMNISCRAGEVLVIHKDHASESLSSQNISSFECIGTEKIPAMWSHIIVACILLITTILSGIMNGTVVFVLFVKKRCFLNRINTYVATVCILSIVVSILGCPMVIISSFAGQWLFTDYGCTFYGFVMTLCGLGTMFILAVIAIDRYLMVNGEFGNFDNNTFSCISTTLCLLLALALSTPPLLGWNQYTYEGLGTSCSPDLFDTKLSSRAYLVVLLTFAFIIPLTAMVYCYCQIFKKVKKIREHLYPGNQKLNTPISIRRQKFVKVESNLALTMVYIVGAFLFCWTPYAVVMIWSVFGSSEIPQLVAAIPTLMTKAGGCLTPVVYIGRNRKMRRVIKDMFSGLKPQPVQINMFQQEMLRRDIITIPDDLI